MDTNDLFHNKNPIISHIKTDNKLIENFNSSAKLLKIEKRDRIIKTNLIDDENLYELYEKLNYLKIESDTSSSDNENDREKQRKKKN